MMAVVCAEFGMCGRGRLARENLKSEAAGGRPATTQNYQVL